MRPIDLSRTPVRKLVEAELARIAWGSSGFETEPWGVGRHYHSPDVISARHDSAAWLPARSACVLSVPSAVVPVADSNDRNVLINHLRPDVDGIAITRIETLEYDVRLFAFG